MRLRRGFAVIAAGLAVVLAGCATDQQPVDLAKVDQPKDPINQTVGKKALPADTPDDKSCGDPTQSVPASDLSIPPGSTMAKIKKRGELIAGVDQNTYLFGYRDPTTGDLEGFDIDMAHDIAGAIFGNPNKVRFKVINSAQRIPALQKGDVDIVARTMTVNCGRRKDIATSAVYYDAKQKLLVNKSSKAQSMDGLGGQKICATTGSTSLITIAKTASKPIPVAVDDWSDCLVLLQQGDVAGVSTDDSILAGMVAQDPNVQIVGNAQADEPYVIGLPKGHNDMVAYVNGVLDEIRGNGKWMNSYNKWIGGKLGPISGPPQPNYGGAPPKGD